VIVYRLTGADVAIERMFGRDDVRLHGWDRSVVLIGGQRWRIK
jgi:hypothetical protein